MPNEVHLGGGLSFRPTLELFDALEASDATSVAVNDVGDPVLTRTRFDLGGGTLTVDAFDYQNDASDRTSFFYYPAGGGSMVLRVEGLLDLEGGWGLIPAFRDGSFPRFDGYVGSSAGRIASDSPVRARIRDFDGAGDQLILSILVSRVLPPEAELVSLAALFGPGTLGDLDQFTLGDATHGAFRFSVGQTAGGDAVLTRRGSQDYTGTNTKSYDERIVLQDLSPDQVSLDRVFIDDIFA
jgi:hypothetical protein